MRLSQRTRSVKPSLTRKLFNMAKDFDDVIDLTLGDPDFNTPNTIKQAGIRAIENNYSHYTMNAGAREARTVIAEHVKKIWSVDCDPDENLIVTVGGMEALFLALLSIVDSGSEVILFSPYYVNYLQMVEICGGTPVVIDAYSSEKGMVIDETVLEERINEKTVAIILNSPNNPTGAVLSAESLHAIAALAEKRDLTIISDEVYRTLLYDGRKHESILQFPQALPRTVLIDSASKEYSMTGWRIGYAYGPEKIISAMIKLQENVAACANVPAQYALAAAYQTKIMETAAMREEFQKRRDILCAELGKIEGLKFYKPQGAFYLFADISACGVSSEEFAYGLLEREHVAVVPGKAYGDMYDGFIRIAFTKKTEVLEQAAKKMKEYIDDMVTEQQKKQQDK